MNKVVQGQSESVVSPVRPVERVSVEPRPAPLWHRAVAGLMKGLIAIAILAGLGWYARDVYLSAPVAERSDRPRIARLVEVTAVEPATIGPRIEAWGEVVAERTLSLRPEVGGRVVWLNPALTAGGRIAEGEALFRLDDTTLKLDLARATATIHGIEARILIEQGQAQRAQRDLDRAPLTLDDKQRALVLRAPQMAQLEAEREAAEAARDAVEVELAKTTVTAPFDALVMAETIAPGATVGANTEVAELVAADAFRVELAVPIAALGWIETDGDGAVRLSQPDAWPEGAVREARIARLAPDLTETGRMAELILRVDDPLALEPANAGKPALLLGSYLQAEIEGRPVEDAVALKRAHLRDGGKVWLMTDDDTLEIRDVEIAWRGAETVLVSAGLEAGDRVVTTHLATVADGMKLRLGDLSAAPGGKVAQKGDGESGG